MVIRTLPVSSLDTAAAGAGADGTGVAVAAGGLAGILTKGPTTADPTPSMASERANATTSAVRDRE
jgi:hypothetical protein